MEFKAKREDLLTALYWTQSTVERHQSAAASKILTRSPSPAVFSGTPPPVKLRCISSANAIGDNIQKTPTAVHTTHRFGPRAISIRVLVLCQV